MENEIKEKIEEYTPLKVDISKLVSIEEYAEKVGKTRQTIYRWVEEKKLKSVKISNTSFVMMP